MTFWLGRLQFWTGLDLLRLSLNQLWFISALGRRAGSEQKSAVECRAHDVRTRPPDFQGPQGKWVRREWPLRMLFLKPRVLNNMKFCETINATTDEKMIPEMARWWLQNRKPRLISGKRRNLVTIRTLICIGVGAAEVPPSWVCLREQGGEVVPKGSPPQQQEQLLTL